MSFRLTSPLFSSLGPLLLPRDGEEGRAVQRDTQHVPGNEVRGPGSAGGRLALPARMEFLGQAGLALGRDLERLSVESVCKPVLRRAELQGDKESPG